MKPTEMFNDLLRQYKHVSMLLPWLISGKLNDEEQLVVKQHLAICDQCRAEWEECQALQGAFHVRAEQSQWQPSEGHFNQLLTILDAVESSTQTASVMPDSIAQSALQSSVRKPQELKNTSRQHFSINPLIAKLSELPSLFRWLFVVESFALVALCLVFVVPKTNNQVTEPAIYETLTSPSGFGIEPQDLRFSLVFAETMTEAEIRNLLKSTGAQMVSGPSDLGVYTVELPASQLTNAKVDDVLAAYRNNPKVHVLESEPMTSIANPDERP